MSDHFRKRHRFILHLGATVAVTAMVPIGDVAAKGATPAEKLAALRTASNKGWLELVRVEDGTGRLVPSEPTAGGSFDKSDQEEFDKK